MIVFPGSIWDGKVFTFCPLLVAFERYEQFLASVVVYLNNDAPWKLGSLQTRAVLLEPTGFMHQGVALEIFFLLNAFP